MQTTKIIGDSNTEQSGAGSKTLFMFFELLLLAFHNSHRLKMNALRSK